MPTAGCEGGSIFSIFRSPAGSDPGAPYARPLPIKRLDGHEVIDEGFSEARRPGSAAP
jgi:hypothetical protein